jgi:hypothetical protein
MNYSSPQGLASLGRNGDSMLVHMNPTEVAGLQSLAMAQGGSLTINPQTGLPEAFSLGGFFKGLLPMFAGMATGGAGMPLWAGIAAGAATGALTNKDNRLLGAVTGGLGGYGGYNLGQGFAAAASPTVPSVPAAGGYVPGTVEGANTALNVAGTYNPALSPATTNLMNQANAAGFAGSAATGATGVDKSFLGGIDRLGPGVQNVGTGIKNVFTGKPGAFDAFKATFVEPGAKPLSDLAAYGKIAMPVGGAALSGLEYSDIYGKPINMGEAKSKEAYDPYATLNLGNSSGLRLVAEGGYIDSYADGGDVSMNVDKQRALNFRAMPVLNVDTGRQTYTTPESVLYNSPQIVKNVYGSASPFSRLFDFGMGARLKDGSSVGQNLYDEMMASRTSYATGGSIQSGGIRDLYGTPDSQPTISPGLAGFGLGRLNNLASEQALNQAQTLGYAMGGPISFADGGDTDMETLGLPSLSSNVSDIKGDINALLPSIIKASLPFKNLQGNTSVPQDQLSNESTDSLITKVAANLKNDPNYQPANALEEAIVKQMRGSDTVQSTSAQGLGSLVPNTPVASSYNASQAMTPTYYAGMNAPKYGMARGGYLNGAGDGMSDSIPATIEGKQPARLADGEFVIPADVVSHLGNGSSKAGSQKLYAMMDRVRKARTGTKKQGKQIKPEKYMPV